MPNMAASKNSRTSPRSSPVSNICGFLSINTWIISTKAEISSTEGMDDSTV